MSEENKIDYSDYFSELQNDIQKESAAKSGNSLQKSSEKATTESFANPKKRKTEKKKKRKIRILPCLALAIVAVALFIAVFALFSKSKKEIKITKKQNGVKQAEVLKSTEKKQKAYVPPTLKKAKHISKIPANIEAKAIIVINNAQNKILAGRNINTKLYPASTTKILTALVAAENITDFNDTFVMTNEITYPLYLENATVAGFMPGESVNMKDLLYGTILPSGADAAIGLAQKISGSEEKFCELMNKKVKELGLKNTHFCNVSGLHNENHYSTAYDMAQILRAAMKNDLIREILSTYQYTTAVTSQHPEGIELTSTLFSYMYGTEPDNADVLGGKTGYTDEAGYCIASFGKTDSGEEIVCVSLGFPSKWPAIFGQINLYGKYLSFKQNP